MIELFIAPHSNNPTSYSRLDLGENETILFSRKRTDYTNPTLIKNSFTKTLHLPGTKSNNEIFDEIYHLFRFQNPNDFNPSRRVPFKLLENGLLKESGYLKLDYINKKDEEVTYECTLYGELGNILYNLSYKEDPNTYEVSPLTLADLDYNIHTAPGGSTLSSGFSITKSVIVLGWKHLTSPSSSDSELFNVFNFCVAYNGQQTIDKFDNKKCAVNLDSTTEFPLLCEVDGIKHVVNLYDVAFKQDGTPTTRGASDAYYEGTPKTKTSGSVSYGLMEFPEAVTDIEAHDLRSYMQRPVMKISAIFDAIDRYLDTNYGYHLVKEGTFWTTSDYTDMYMTLPLLSEVIPDIESKYRVTYAKMLSKTSSPASYLISFCKIFGIYLDVDVAEKQLILRRVPQFFTDKVNAGIIDVATDQKITPLSFDKSSYTFDYADSDNDRLKTYKETNGIAYGSKKVNTGYQFDASSAPYITNNVFKNAAVSLLQSKYYRCVDMPRPLVPAGSSAKFSLFHYNTDTNVYETNDSLLISRDQTGQDKGYTGMDVKWQGLRVGLWQDGFPKLEFQSQDGKAKDGSNVLVKFRGMIDCKRFDVYTLNPEQAQETTQDEDTNANTIFYENTDASIRGEFFTISDDVWFKEYIGNKNCWISSQMDTLDASIADALPLFSVMNISNSTSDTTVIKEESGRITGLGVKNGSIYQINTQHGYNGVMFTPQSGTTGPKYPYISIHSTKKGDNYFVSACVSCDSLGVFEEKRILPTFGTLVDSKQYSSVGKYQTIGTIFTSSANSTELQVKLPQLKGVSEDLYINNYRVVNLTKLGLDKQLLTVEDALNYFGRFKGHDYWVTESSYFGSPRELFVPNTKLDTTSANLNIYDQYWKNYISDIYNVNTRVLECRMKIDNYNTAFREFYTYDNCLWILSEVTDYDNETHTCKAKLLKVNDKNNYLN